ncbi:MAG TPA: hypothetical protein VFL80_04725 [Thermoanaerobaculia bacterium]|nr:hypothetical protein [Thermoanaerobaculia bacterium]
MPGRDELAAAALLRFAVEAAAGVGRALTLAARVARRAGLVAAAPLRPAEAFEATVRRAVVDLFAIAARFAVAFRAGFRETARAERFAAPFFAPAFRATGLRPPREAAARRDAAGFLVDFFLEPRDAEDFLEPLEDFLEPFFEAAMGVSPFQNESVGAPYFEIEIRCTGVVIRGTQRAARKKQ